MRSHRRKWEVIPLLDPIARDAGLNIIIWIYRDLHSDIRLNFCYNNFMDTITFLIFGLATWRIASLIVNETGPGRVFQHFREKVAGIQHDEDGEPFGIPETFLGGLFGCVWCVSVWAGFGWGIFWLASPTWATWTACAFALSTVAIALQEILSFFKNS